MDAGRDFDVLIAGGGMVGASLACALGGNGLKIGIIEAVSLDDGGASYDDRSIALALGTQRVFAAMGLWPQVQPHATPIEKIHVSDRGHFGALRMDCRKEGVPALGYVAESRALGATLTAALAALDNVTLLCPAALEDVDDDEHAVHAVVQQNGHRHRLSARLLVAADGGRSAVRRILGIHSRSWDYGQSAVIANVTPARHHGFTAYERFTDTGPLALLPMSEGRCALVWTHRRDAAAAVTQLSDARFLATLQERFGYRLGRFLRVGRRSLFALQLITALEHTRHRIALIGNAAHTLHPVAGQGFNLGLRDVAALAELVMDAARAGADPGSAGVLARYAQWRRADQRRVVAFTDALVRIFSNDFPPLVLARDVGMTALDLLPGLKRRLIARAMGVSGRLPRLARGLPP